MKRSLIIGLGGALLLASGAIAKDLPQMTQPLVRNLMGKPAVPALTADQSPLPAQKQSQLQLQLAAAKRVEVEGKTTWQAAGSKLTAKPGDVLRYTLKGANQGQTALNNLELTQPVPQGMVYALNSVVNPGGTLTYSIDGGKTYQAKPMVKVVLANGQTETRPAPAEAYTHLHWQLTQALAAGNQVEVAYEVVVR
jgi:uncharacterized repeat protein (TIGR01451 family)